MPTPRLLTALLLTTLSLTGCATQGADDASGSGPGGKADDGSEDAGLHIVPFVTDLGPDNELRWPVAEDDSSEVDDVINAQLDFETITGEKVEDIVARFDSGETGGGVVNVDYTDVATRGVVSLSIEIEFLGAYDSVWYEHKNFNDLTGASVAITDLLSEDMLPQLARTLDTQLQQRIAEVKEANRDRIESGELAGDEWDNLHITAADLATFSATREGLAFHWTAGFPHVLKSLEPDGEFAVSMFDLEDYISADGLWAEEY